MHASRQPDPADALPVGEVDLLDGSDERVRQLLEALRLEGRYDKRTHRARYRAVVRGRP